MTVITGRASAGEIHSHRGWVMSVDTTAAESVREVEYGKMGVHTYLGKKGGTHMSVVFGQSTRWSIRPAGRRAMTLHVRPSRAVDAQFEVCYD